MTEGDAEAHERRNIVDRFSLLVSRATMICIPVIVVIMGYEIVMRYAFRQSTIWVHDLSIWLGAIVYLMAGLYAMQKRAHISITLLYDHVPRRVRLSFDVIALVVILTFAGGLIFGAGPSAWSSFMIWERVGTTWNPPVPGTVKPLIIVVIFLVAVQAVSNFIADYREGRKTSDVPPEVD